MTPSRLGREPVARAAKALIRRPQRLVLLAGALLASVAVLALRRVNPQPRFPYPSAQSVTDPFMRVISTMVERGDLWEATAMIGISYRFDKPAGLLALRRFSVLVLRRGLQEYDSYERCYAISALATAGDQSQIASLVRIFQRTGASDLKMAVADGLGDVGGAAAVEALSYLYRRTQPSSRWIVVNGAAEARAPGVLKFFGHALTVSDRATRLAAEKGIGHLADSGAVHILRRALAATQDPLERATIGYSLLRLHDSSAEQGLEATLRGGANDNARAVAALALSHAHAPRVVPLLRAALGDHDIDVQIGAAVALTHYADPAGATYLEAAMREEDAVTRLHVGQLLDEVEFHNARAVVMAATASPDPELYLRGIRAIGLSGGDRDIEFLVRLGDTAEDPLARAEVAWALGRIGSAGSVAPLMAMVSESDRAVRYTAADALDRTAMQLLRDKAAGGA